MSHFIYILFFSAFLAPKLSPQHEFHSSLAEANYNPKTKSFEVSLRVFADDLERTLSKFGNTKVRYGTLGQDFSEDKVLISYLEKVFYFKNKQNNKIQLKYLGKKVETEIILIYFEIPAKENPKGMTLFNTVMLEVFDDQFNIVNITYQGQKQTFMFKKGDEKFVL
jgi:hypothetical protein